MNLPWLFKRPSEMTQPEYAQFLIASMQVGSSIQRLQWFWRGGWAQ